MFGIYFRFVFSLVLCLLMILTIAFIIIIIIIIMKKPPAITWKVIWCFLELSSCYLSYIWRLILIRICIKIMQRNEIPETPSFRIFSHWSSKYSMCACHFSGCQRLPFKNLLHGLLMQNCKYLQLLVPKLCLLKYWVYVDAMAQEALLCCKPILS